MIYQAQHISIAIQKPPAEVYDYASKGENLPTWASGLANSKLKKSGDDWIAESPIGAVTIRFAKKNEFGVLDHDVTLPNGDVVHNPMRVSKNGDGSEVTFILYRLPKVSGKDFAKDAATIEKDLRTLKTIMEK